MEPLLYPLTAYPSGSERLGFLRPSLTAMFAIMDCYLEKFDRVGQMDRPYFYNERATLSIFAGAVWRSHPSNLVVEEYCAEKVYPGGRYQGRFDIWFLAENRSCYAEAKQCWPAASTFDEEEGQAVLTVLRNEADIAQGNVAKDIEAGFVHHALGIVFVTPLIPKSRGAKAESIIAAFEQNLDEQLKVLTSDGSYHVLRGTYFRPDLLKEHWFASLEPRVRIYPGVDILICERRQSKESSLRHLLPRE